MSDDNKKIEDNKQVANTKASKEVGVNTSKEVSTAQKPAVNSGNGVANVVAKSVYGKKQFKKKFGRKSRGNNYVKDEFEQKILDIARVTRVMAGGKRMRFRACVAVGDKKGKIGIGLGKGIDVTIAINKAVNIAKKNLIEVPIVNDTIPHEIRHKFSASRLMFKPARRGRGVIAGGIIRIIMELAGIKNITSKILGTTNKVSNAKCTIEALSRLRKVEKKKAKSEKKDKSNNDNKEK